MKRIKRLLITKYVLLAVVFVFWTILIYVKMRHPLDYRHELRLQYFPNFVADWLVWLIPLLALSILIMLVNPQVQQYALILSLLTLLAFNGYISFVLIKYPDIQPCSCAGFFSSWLKQLSLNTVLLFCSAGALLLRKYTANYYIQFIITQKKGGSIATV